MKREKLIVLLGMLLVLCIVCFAACGAPDEGETGDATGDVTGDVTGDAEDQTENTGEKTLTIGLGNDINGLDPHYFQATIAFSVLEHVIEPLVRKNEATGEYEGVLAESYEISENNLEYTFHLRQGVKFHSGNEFNAQAVAHTFDRTYKYEIGTSRRHITDLMFDHYEIIDDYTIKIVTTDPNPIFLETLYAFGIVDPECYPDGAEMTDQTKVSGTGPFRFVEWVPDDHTTLVANDDYWGGRVSYDKLIFRVIPESSTRVAELLSGGVDFIMNPPIDQLADLETETTSVIYAECSRDLGLGINFEYPYMDDVRVRQAMNYAVDKEAINDALFDGRGDIYGGFCMPPHNDPSLEPYPYDPEKAKQLLAEAGVPEGLEIKIQTTTGRYLREKEISQAVAGYLNDVGFNASVEVLDYSILNEYRNAGKEGGLAELNYIGLGGYFTGVGELAWVQYGMVGNTWQNEEFDALAEEAKRTMDNEQRQELLNQCQQLAHEECPWIFLFRQPTYYAIGERLQNWQYRADEYMYFWDCDVAE